MSDQLDQFRAKAVSALAQLNTRIDQDKSDAAARLEEERADRGARRARAAIRSTRVTIASVVAVAAAGASIWDLANLTRELGSSPVWGVAAGGALDLGWIYLSLLLYAVREDPAKALKPYRRSSALLMLSAVLNVLSGVLAAGHGIGVLVLGLVSGLMPVMVKVVLGPLLLGDSLAGELLVTRKGRARVESATKDRHGRALAAFDAGFRLESERAEFSAEAELQRQRAQFELQREATALEFQLSRDQMTRAAYEAAGLTASADVPAALVAHDTDRVPAQVRTEATAARTVSPRQAATAPAEPHFSDGTSGGTSQDIGGEVPQIIASESVRSAGTERHLTPVRGTATAQIRDLIGQGLTNVPEIRTRLVESGVKAPDPSYVRRIIRETRNNEGTDAPMAGTGNYM